MIKFAVVTATAAKMTSYSVYLMPFTKSESWHSTSVYMAVAMFVAPC